MLDPKINPMSADLFSSMTRKELVESLEKVVNLDENKLELLFKEYEIAETYLFKILLKRKEYLSYVLEIIKKSPQDAKINLEFLQEIRDKILSRH